MREGTLVGALTEVRSRFAVDFARAGCRDAVGWTDRCPDVDSSMMSVRPAALVIAVGAAVWAFAVIGVLSVVQAMSPDPSPVDRADSLLPAASEIPGQEVAGLPRYEGSVRSEYRRHPYGNLTLTEAEYVDEAAVAKVRKHYEDAFQREGWTVLDTRFLHGEWTFTIARGERAGTLEIERVNGLTEVEIEISEPIPDRDSRSDR
jgi:hypothetical protein